MKVAIKSLLREARNPNEGGDLGSLKSLLREARSPNEGGDFLRVS